MERKVLLDVLEMIKARPENRVATLESTVYAAFSYVPPATVEVGGRQLGKTLRLEAWEDFNKALNEWCNQNSLEYTHNSREERYEFKRKIGMAEKKGGVVGSAGKDDGTEEIISSRNKKAGAPKKLGKKVPVAIRMKEEIVEWMETNIPKGKQTAFIEAAIEARIKILKGEE